jgi:predicted ATP-dependent Lon-type protease
VVRKDLLHQIKGGENVPSYVLEYLLGKYCASDNDEEIRIGVDAVKETLTTNYFRHDEANKAQSMVEQKGRHRFIDRIEVRFLASENKYWASMDHFGYTKIHIPEEFSPPIRTPSGGRHLGDHRRGVQTFRGRQEGQSLFISSTSGPSNSPGSTWRSIWRADAP